MKNNQKRILSVILAGSLLLGEGAAAISSAPVYAAGVKKRAEKEKYIRDVFIAYGNTEADAEKWLKDNGWEVLKGSRDFNAGKNSSDGRSVAAVMGIRRTDKAKDAITDMAVMNMQGGYSFPDYEEILEEKRAEIDDFIYSFLPTIEEYRANFNGEGSEAGQRRAELAYELMNKFYDGNPEERYCKNDTGLPLGDLFLEALMQEGAGEGSGDLEQIILEGSKPAVAAVENALALAADTGEDSWMERLEYLTMDELTENLGNYVPEAEGQDIAPSAAMSFLMQEYGDAAETMASQWENVHERLKWCEDFRAAHDLDMHGDESVEEYSARYGEALKELRDKEEVNPGELDKYTEISILEAGLEVTCYPGEWGETLADFFKGAGDGAYDGGIEPFLPMAAALSEGQRCGLAFLPLELLLKVGVSNGEGDEDLFADTDELLCECDSISVYSGVNRGIFRDGVALTSKALMEDSKGDVPAMCYEINGGYNALCISMIVIGSVSIVAAAVLMRCAYRTAKARGVFQIDSEIKEERNYIAQYKKDIKADQKEYDRIEKLVENTDYSNRGLVVDDGRYNDFWEQRELQKSIGKNEALIEEAEKSIQKLKTNEYNKNAKTYSTRMAVGSVLLGIGALLLIAGIMLKITEMKESCDNYQNKEFSQIPAMIVDVDDIVTYVKVNGEIKRHIELDQYAYYEAVKCNRQAVGELGKWQKGVSDYEKKGCGDIADLNADQGLEWLALYTVKAAARGACPILADSLKLAYGKENKPDVTASSVHFFGDAGRVDLADRAYCYSSDKGEMYFSWDVEKAA